MKKKIVFALLGLILLSLVVIGLWYRPGQTGGLASPAHASVETPAATASVTVQSASPSPSQTPRLSTGPYVSFLAPGFTLMTLDGKQISLAEYQGKVVMINFWASWCIPCKAEMPLIQAEYQKNRQKGLVVVGINMTNQDNRPAIESFIRESGVTFPIGLDQDGAVSNQYRVINIPTSFFIDRSGVIRHFQLGATDQAQLEQYLNEMLR